MVLCAQWSSSCLPWGSLRQAICCSPGQWAASHPITSGHWPRSLGPWPHLLLTSVLPAAPCSWGSSRPLGVAGASYSPHKQRAAWDTTQSIDCCEFWVCTISSCPVAERESVQSTESTRAAGAGLRPGPSAGHLSGHVHTPAASVWMPKSCHVVSLLPSEKSEPFSPSFPCLHYSGHPKSVCLCVFLFISGLHSCCIELAMGGIAVLYDFCWTSILIAAAELAGLRGVTSTSFGKKTSLPLLMVYCLIWWISKTFKCFEERKWDFWKPRHFDVFLILWKES